MLLEVVKFYFYIDSLLNLFSFAKSLDVWLEMGKILNVFCLVKEYYLFYFLCLILYFINYNITYVNC